MSQTLCHSYDHVEFEVWQGVQIELLGRPIYFKGGQLRRYDILVTQVHRDDSESYLKYNCSLIQWLKRKYYRVYDNTLKNQTTVWEEIKKKSELWQENLKNRKQNTKQSEMNKENKDREKNLTRQNKSSFFLNTQENGVSGGKTRL